MKHIQTLGGLGQDRVTGPPDGGVTRRRYTNIWQLQSGHWRTIARHAQVLSRKPADRPGANA